VGHGLLWSGVIQNCKEFLTLIRCKGETAGGWNLVSMGHKTKAWAISSEGQRHMHDWPNEMVPSRGHVQKQLHMTHWDPWETSWYANITVVEGPLLVHSQPSITIPPFNKFLALQNYAIHKTINSPTLQ